ncbi:MAG TPA: hypothetical protein VFS00_08720, partial [Polyangiaceae bacterium]|nr:hypothetical protein [Polyangiaceae bacterium]
KGAAEAALGGHAGAGGEGLHGGAGAGGEGLPEGVGAGGWLGALHLRSAPATVTASLLVTFSWLASVSAGWALDAWGAGPVARWTLGALALVLAPLASLPAVSLLVRPLARFFVTRRAARGRRDFVGKVCTVRTGTVDEAFGEAVLAERGAEVIVRVRLDGPGALGRGDQALIIAFDEARDAFAVAPFDELEGLGRLSGPGGPGRLGGAGRPGGSGRTGGPGGPAETKGAPRRGGAAG